MKPLRLIETSWEVFGARCVLMNLKDLGYLKLDKEKKKEDKAYTYAIYDLLMNDEEALLEWLALPQGVMFRYYDHQYDKKGKLIKCKAQLI